MKAVVKIRSQTTLVGQTVHTTLTIPTFKKKLYVGALFCVMTPIAQAIEFRQEWQRIQTHR